MSENIFLTFQKFNTKDEAVELADLLKANSIDFLLEDASTSFDPTFSNNEINKEFRINLKQIDFDKADKLLITTSTIEINKIDKEYYLFQFSNEELFEILEKSDEWSKFDYVLAQKLLKERGQDINENMLESLKRQRIRELAKPEENQKGWINAGYIFAVLGGLLGIFIGWHLNTHKKTLPNGNRVYAYSTNDRKHGKRILNIGIIFFFIWTLVKVFSLM